MNKIEFYSINKTFSFNFFLFLHGQSARQLKTPNISSNGSKEEIIFETFDKKSINENEIKKSSKLIKNVETKDEKNKLSCLSLENCSDSSSFNKSINDDVATIASITEDKLTTKEQGSYTQNKQPLSHSLSATADSTNSINRQSTTSKMKTINRFSNFVKTGMESYILAASKLTKPPTKIHQILIKNNQIMWQESSDLYTCVVSKPKKESKLKGLKSFIAYSLTCSLSGIQVSRRYKHFDWLHEQLSNKYLLIPIPPLPEKQVAGRYEEDLIEHRKCILQLWVNKICCHPVLSQSEVWKHFITCTDTAKWKAGKRIAEKDEYVGGNFFHCISAPKQPLDLAKIEHHVENYSKSVRSQDESIKELYDRITDTQKRFVGPYKSYWQKMSNAFDMLSKSLDLDQTQQPNNSVKSALKTTAHVLHKIGMQQEEYGKKKFEPILDYLYTYKGLFTNIPDIVNVHKSALSKVHDKERLKQLTPTDAEAIRERVDVTTYAMLAEINHLTQERDNDFRQMFSAFFTQQSKFYTEMGCQMAEIARLYLTPE